MQSSSSAKPVVSEPKIDQYDESTESLSEDSGQDAVPVRPINTSQLHLAVRYWDPALEAFGVAAGNESNAGCFSRFLWRLDVAIGLRGREARLGVAPWLRTLANDEGRRRACFRIAAEEESNAQRNIVQIYDEMRGVR